MQGAFLLGVRKGSPVPAMGDVVQEPKQPKSMVGKVQEISISHLKAVYSSSIRQHNLLSVTMSLWAVQWDFRNSCAHERCSLKEKNQAAELWTSFSDGIRASGPRGHHRL